MTNCLDCSNYSGPLSADQVQALKTSGITKVIVQAVDPPHPYPPTQTRQQLQALSAGGIEAEGYVYLWFDEDLTKLQQRLSLVAGFGLRRVWLDVEDNSAGHTTQNRVGRVRGALTAIEQAGYSTGIYTGRWYWEPYMGDATDFAQYPLWDADYNGNDSLDPFLPYGGWTARAIKQWQGTSTFCGIPNVDLDVYEIEGAPELTREEIIALIDAGIDAQIRVPLEAAQFGWQASVERRLTALEDGAPEAPELPPAVTPDGPNLHTAFGGG